MKIHDFKKRKEAHKKISMVTCYDYPSASMVAESDIDCALVGDSVAMVVHGYDSTVMATMDMMVLHTRAVARGIGRQFLIADLPFLAHRTSRAQTVRNVHRLMQAGAHAVKIEGGDLDTCESIAYLVKSGVPVIGHIGLTPQSIHQLGYKVQGKESHHALRLKEEAGRLETAGCTALVIECVPSALAKEITEILSIPTIGIGAGHCTDGQVLVWHDLLALQTAFKPKFVKQYAQGKADFLKALNAYAHEVRDTLYPSETYSYD
ncbi:MAG: 3-methyl-2-oxobutanoate hydroxymethyltransferase [Legionella sp.]|nr:3-methyl-2-oxobutanoate hydroxymethyltransferase [Legionella sp.]